MASLNLVNGQLRVASCGGPLVLSNTAQACCCGGVCCHPDGQCITEGVTKEQCERCGPPGWLNACFETAEFICYDPETGVPTSYPPCPDGYFRSGLGGCGKLIEMERAEEPCSCMSELLGFGVLSQLPCFIAASYITNCDSGPVEDICGKWANSCDDCGCASCLQGVLPDTLTVSFSGLADPCMASIDGKSFVVRRGSGGRPFYPGCSERTNEPCVYSYSCNPVLCGATRNAAGDTINGGDSGLEVQRVIVVYNGPNTPLTIYGQVLRYVRWVAFDGSNPTTDCVENPLVISGVEQHTVTMTADENSPDCSSISVTATGGTVQHAVPPSVTSDALPAGATATVSAGGGGSVPECRPNYEFRKEYERYDAPAPDSLVAQLTWKGFTARGTAYNCSTASALMVPDLLDLGELKNRFYESDADGFQTTYQLSASVSLQDENCRFVWKGTNAAYDSGIGYDVYDRILNETSGYIRTDDPQQPFLPRPWVVQPQWQTNQQVFVTAVKYAPNPYANYPAVTRQCVWVYPILRIPLDDNGFPSGAAELGEPIYRTEFYGNRPDLDFIGRHYGGDIESFYFEHPDGRYELISWPYEAAGFTERQVCGNPSPPTLTFTRGRVERREPALTAASVSGQPVGSLTIVPADNGDGTWRIQSVTASGIPSNFSDSMRLSFAGGSVEAPADVRLYQGRMAPTIDFEFYSSDGYASGGSEAALSATMSEAGVDIAGFPYWSVSDISITSGGSGYSVGDFILGNPTGGSQTPSSFPGITSFTAEVTAVTGTGAIASIQILHAGAYYKSDPSSVTAVVLSGGKYYSDVVVPHSDNPLP